MKRTKNNADEVTVRDSRTCLRINFVCSVGKVELTVEIDKNTEPAPDVSSAQVF
jgi:hypothetical protein